MSGVQKAAVLLITLGDHSSAELLRHLGEDSAHRVSSAIADLPPLSPDDVRSVLEEFCEKASVAVHTPRGGMAVSRKLLTEAFGSDTGDKILEKLPGAKKASPGVDSLQKADPQQLARFVHHEHPQTIALVLSSMNPNQAAGLLSSLSPELRMDVASRMGSLEQISTEMAERVAVLIGEKLNSLKQRKRQPFGGVRSLAEILNHMESAVSTELLSGLTQTNSQLAGSVRGLMFTFDEFQNIGASGLRELTSKLDRKVLMTGLKGTSHPLRQHFMSTMSPRAAEMLKEDMEALGPVKIKDVAAAQQQIIALARKLEEDGVISMKGAAEERYVD
jgi:flagellar motor switch protein FliG